MKIQRVRSISKINCFDTHNKRFVTFVQIKKKIFVRNNAKSVNIFANVKSNIFNPSFTKVFLKTKL